MFSTGTECFSEISARPARAACSRVAAAGSRSAHRFTGGGPSPGLLCGGSSSSGIARPRASASNQVATSRRLARPRKTGSSSSAPSFIGSACTAETIAESGSTRPGATSRRRAMSSRACQSDAQHAQLPAAAQPVHAGGAPPRVGLGRRAGRRRGSPRTPGGPSRSCPAPRGSRPARRAGRPAPRRRGRRRPATPRAAAGCSSRRPSGPSAARSPSSDSTTAPRPTRGRPASRAASSVSKIRRGTRPISARQGRSWLAACSTHSASAMASWITERSGSGTGSTRPVPEPLRRSCTR